MPDTQLWVPVRHVINSGLHEGIQLCMLTLVGSRSSIGDQVRSGQRGKAFFCSPNRSDRPQDPSSLPIKLVLGGAFHGGQSSRADNLPSSGSKYTAGFLSSGDETTVKTLMHIILTTQTIHRPLPGFKSSSADAQDRISMEVDCDEVYPNIYIGAVCAAKNKQYLRRIGITHILNTAEGNKFGMVNTSKDYYRDTNIKYMGVQLLDLPVTNISAHFAETADFIENGVKSGGKVLVHCVMGMSRSSTCVLSYLMIKEDFTATEAVRRVRLHRAVHPNEGFLHQLAELDNKLRRERGHIASL